MRARLLDPRFRYVPASATDVRSTWRRFGFDPRSNEERRARLREALAEADRAEAPAVCALVRIRC
jgi:hypothetical protein